MKVSDLKPHVFDNVTIYEEQEGDYHDLYKGILGDAPNHILELEVGIIGASGNVVDIEVR